MARPVHDTSSVRTLEHEFAPGARVCLQARAGCEEFFDRAYVLRQCRHFGESLPYSLEVLKGGGRFRIKRSAPWEL